MALSTKNRELFEQELLEMAIQARGKIEHIYLHWTAGAYGHVYTDYHFCIDETGQFMIPVGRQLDCLTQKLAHTWQRNGKAVGVAIMGAVGSKAEWPEGEGLEITWGKRAPITEAMIDGLARAVAILCYGLQLPVNVDTVATHAEVAKLDFYDLQSGDPECKWDLLRLPFKGVNGNGGDYIRKLVRDYLAQLERNEYEFREH